MIFFEFLLLIKFTAAASFELESGSRHARSLMDAAESIINTSFTPRGATTINFIIALNNDTKRERIGLINDLVSRCASVAVIEDVEAIHPRHRLFNVLFIDEFKSFVRLFSKISADTFVIDGFYLMIFVEGPEPQLSEITKLLWSIFLFNIDFLEATSEKNSDINLWTFIPFKGCDSDLCHKRKCGDTTPKVINQFISGSFHSHDGGHDGDDKHFPEKISNLHQCPVKIVTFNAPPMMMIYYSDNQTKFRLAGVDGEMIALLSEQLNFTIDLFHISDNIR